MFASPCCFIVIGLVLLLFVEVSQVVVDCVTIGGVCSRLGGGGIGGGRTHRGDINPFVVRPAWVYVGAQQVVLAHVVLVAVFVDDELGQLAVVQDVCDLLGEEAASRNGLYVVSTNITAKDAAIVADVGDAEEHAVVVDVVTLGKRLAVEWGRHNNLQQSDYRERQV